MPLLGLSDLFGRLQRSPQCEAALRLPPPQGGTLLALSEIGPEALTAIPAMVNVGALFVLWRQAPRRRVWRVRPETAAYLRTVNLSFLPELPPASWSGAAIVIESTDKSPLVRDYFSIGAYQCEDTQGRARYFVVGLRSPDGVFASGIRSDLARLNERLAKSGELLDLGMLDDDDPDPQHTTPPDREHQHIALDLLRYVLAASYYALDPRPGLVAVRESPGLPERDAHGKTRREGGRPAPLWTYADLSITAAPSPAGEVHGSLDTSSLTLAPVVVRPYVRRSESGRVTIVDAHDSHRWKHAATPLGTKTKI